MNSFINLRVLPGLESKHSGVNTMSTVPTPSSLWHLKKTTTRGVTIKSDSCYKRGLQGLQEGRIRELKPGRAWGSWHEAETSGILPGVISFYWEHGSTDPGGKAGQDMGVGRTSGSPLTLVRKDGILRQGNGKENGQKQTGPRATSELVSTEFCEEPVWVGRKQGQWRVCLRRGGDRSCLVKPNKELGYLPSRFLFQLILQR